VHALLTRNPERAGRAYLGRLADDYGFTSASHFSRVFREQFGYSPREAREMAPAMVQGALLGSNALLGDGRFGRWNFEPAR
jgi:AraC-like DNA-binding protein